MVPVGALLLIWCLQHLSNSASALSTSPPQLDPVAFQAISHLVAQQAANGITPGGTQIIASTGPNGISIQGISNNQNIATSNGNVHNQTTSSLSGGNAGVAPANAISSGSGGHYVFKWLHSDPKSQQAVFAIVPVNQTNNLHEPRIELRYQSKEFGYVSVPQNSSKDYVVAAIIISDEDSGVNGQTTVSIERGNEQGHFKLVSTEITNTIQVDKPLSRDTRQEYNLTIVARDHGSPPKSSSANLVIKVYPTPNAAPPFLPQIDPKQPVSDLMYLGTMLVLMFAAAIILIIFGCALVQRPQRSSKHNHKGQPPTRTTSASNSRIISPNDQCTPFCMSGYNLANLSAIQ